MDMQLHNHINITINQMVELQGNNKKYTEEYLNKCLYVVGMGSNDYLNNYFQPQTYSSSRQFTPEQYAEHVVKHYTQQLTVSALVCV